MMGTVDKKQWERIRQAQLHTVAHLHSHLALYPTQFVIERLDPQFCDTYIIQRSSYTTIKVFLCMLVLSFAPYVYSTVVATVLSPPLDSPANPSVATLRSILSSEVIICCTCGPLITFIASIIFYRMLAKKPFEVGFIGFAKAFLNALFYNGLGPWGKATPAKGMIREAYQWQHDMFGSIDIIVISMSMAVMVVLSTTFAGCWDGGGLGLIFGLACGILFAFISLFILNLVLGASSDLISCVDAELKTFQPHWKLLGYGSDLSDIESRDSDLDKHLRSVVSEAANSYEKISTASEAADFLDGRVYNQYFVETALDAKAVSSLSEKEHEDLRQISRLIREEGVDILRRMLVWLNKHSNELTYSQKACWRLFKAASKPSMLQVFACDEYALAVLSFLDPATFLGMFFDTQFKLLTKIGWSTDRFLTKIFIANPQQFLYEMEVKSKKHTWCVKASKETYLAEKKDKDKDKDKGKDKDRDRERDDDRQSSRQGSKQSPRKPVVRVIDSEPDDDRPPSRLASKQSSRQPVLHTRV